METIFPFTLPRGYVDTTNRIHRVGKMRLATAMDEILVLGDPRLQANEAYLTVLLLSRVVEMLGDLPAISPQIIEGLFASDLAYLEDLYQRLNIPEPIVLGAVCPHCSNWFRVQVAPIDAVLENV